MEFLRRLGLWVSLLGVCVLTAAAIDVDTDGDGVVDSEEVTLGTDPANSQSVTWRALASWRFSDGTLNGDAGQQPIAQSGVSIINNGFVGPGVSIGSSGIVSLKYRATELSGKPNISPVRGSILFRIKPNWETWSGGPGYWVTVLQTTNWALRINPTGNSLMLTNTTPGGGIIVSIPIDVSSFGDFWSYGLVTYSPEQTSISFDKPSSRVAGAGIPAPANLNDPNNFLSIGSAPDGSGALNGSIDEIVAFNASGVLGLTPSVISAVTSNSPAGLNIVWASPTNLIAEVKRRVVGDSTWGPVRAAFGTNLFDSTVSVGTRYQYNINTRIADESTGAVDNNGQNFKACLAGTPLHNRGKIILLVEQSLMTTMSAEVNSYITNLVGDGWQVLQLNVPRHIDDYSSSTSFRTNFYNITNAITPFIKSNYAVFGPEIKYVLALGHVPIPYTGTIADDGHTQQINRGAHTGAWAADTYYGDVDGLWTDIITKIDSSYSFNWNNPGDGKLDQNYIPANSSGVAKMEMAVSRIDFGYLPIFPESETELTKKYLKKNANYRTGVRTFAAEGLAAEYFPIPGIVPATTLGSELLSRVSPLKAPVNADAFVDTRSALIGVQSGAGAFDRINDSIPGYEHTSDNIVNGLTTTNCAFYFLRGSYFPDWNTQNNFMRSVLGLTNGGLAVGGLTFFTRAWRADGLGVGHGIGSDMLDVVNSWTTLLGQSVRTVELLGDPTLHYPITVPASTLSAVVTNHNISLKWFAAAGASSYFVYRSTNGALGTFDRLNTDALTTTNYTDVNVPAGQLVYMVRAAALVTSGGGSYTNLSQGIFSRSLTSADPSNCCIADQTVNEDSPLSAKAFSLGEAANDAGLTLTATSSDTTLLPDGNIVLAGSGANRTIAITVPATNQFGSAIITVKAQTDVTTVVKTFTVTVSPVNDAPSFTKGTDLAVAQNAAAQSLSGWATAISSGPGNESAQTVSFLVSSDGSYLFSAQPAVSPSGTLTFTPIGSQRGVAHVSVQLKDNGGTANSGVDTSAVQTLNITVGLPTDTDGDGLPDDFEQYYGFNPNAGGDGQIDWDGDGLTNAQELAAGTDPKNPRSTIRINSAASLSPTFSVKFNSVSGKTYTVQWNDNFANNDWHTLNAPVAGTGAAIEQLDASAGSSTRRIYQVISSGPAGDVTTEYAGLCRLTLLGNSDTYVSVPFLRPAAELGAVTAVNGSQVQLRGSPNWQANQWVYASGSQSNTYFMLIRSGTLAGNFFTVTANNTDTLTLDLEGGSLAGLAAGDSISVVPYWTVGTLFHGGEGANISPSPATRQTEVFFPNIGGQGTDLSAAATYYFWNGAWRKIGAGSAVRNDDVIPPDMYVIVRHNIATSTTLTTEGAVLRGGFRTLVARNASLKQDNLLALPRPLAVSLGQSGLISSDAFRTSTSTTDHLDELLFFDNSATGRNKSAAGAYYYSNGAWRKVGLGAADQGADLVFQPGAGVIIRSGVGANAVWLNQPSY